MLNIDTVNQYYGGSHILRGLSLQVGRGQVLALLGRNGVGKTTLLKSIMGLIGIRGGSISLDGQRIDKMRPDARARLGIGYVPQGREIFPRLTVEENLCMGLATQPGGSVIPDELYELFPVLKQMLHRRGGDLSGGQQQQLAIARALATNPKVLLLDEPTEGIQPSIIKDIARSLREIRELRELTIIVSEQVLSFTLDIADRFFVIDKGRFVYENQRANVDEKVISSYLSI